MSRRPIVILLACALGVCLTIAALMYWPGSGRGTAARPQPGSMEQMILDAARSRPGDAALGQLFEELNTRHFGGGLPNIKVLWENDLDRLDLDDYRLNGMTDGKLVLLKTALKDDDANVRRTLCHEMVHVKFIAGGNRSTTHDAPFQEELRRVFTDGCFQAILASPDERASLKQWIETERTRLDAGRLQVSAQGAAVKIEAEAVERNFAELNERIKTANAAGSGWPGRDEIETAERRRTESNTSVVAYNSAVAGLERDQAQFNEVVQRYNLMLAYPDGLAEDRAKGLIR